MSYEISRPNIKPNPIHITYMRHAVVLVILFDEIKTFEPKLCQLVSIVYNRQQQLNTCSSSSSKSSRNVTRNILRTYAHASGMLKIVLSLHFWDISVCQCNASKGEKVEQKKKKIPQNGAFTEWHRIFLLVLFILFYFYFSRL